MKKSLEELKAIREQTLKRIELRTDEGNQTRVIVGMATCGIAAGARPVMLEFMKEIEKRGLSNVTVSQTGCIGMCKYEPLVDVLVPGQEKVTYVNLKPEHVGRIVAEHIVNVNVVRELTISEKQ